MNWCPIYHLPQFKGGLCTLVAISEIALFNFHTTRKWHSYRSIFGSKIFQDTFICFLLKSCGLLRYITKETTCQPPREGFNSWNLTWLVKLRQNIFHASPGTTSEYLFTEENKKQEQARLHPTMCEMTRTIHFLTIGSFLSKRNYVFIFGCRWIINASEIISQVRDLCDNGWLGGWCGAVLVSGFIATFHKNSLTVLINSFRFLKIIKIFCKLVVRAMMGG